MFRKMQFYQRMLLIVVAWSALIAAPQAFAYKQIVAGAHHTCGLKSNGSATCWGFNNHGQSTAPSGTFTQLSAGSHHTCGLKSDGSAVCWGENGFGQTTVPSGTFTQISAGSGHTCGLKSDGSATCWGAGKTNTGINSEHDQSIVPSGTFTQLSAGMEHTCGLKSDGSVVCWGWNNYGLTTVPSGSFIQLSAGYAHTCGLKSDGSVVCWGAGKTNTGGTDTNREVEFGQSIVPVDSDCSATEISAAKQAGIDQCKTNPASCGLFTQAQIDAAKQSGINQCAASPASCGFAACSAGEMAGLQRIYLDQGIAQCKANPASCGITKLDGISTNAFITPANKMIAGVLISGGTKRLMVRASSVDGAVDPLLEIVTYPDRKPLGSNDSWATDPAAAELTQKKLAPARATDAAVIINLPPGLFTMEITSKNGGSGAGVIEVYDMAVFP